MLDIQTLMSAAVCVAMALAPCVLVLRALPEPKE